MNIYDDGLLEEKLDIISNEMGHLVMDMLLLSMKKMKSDSRSLNKFMNETMTTYSIDDPF